MRRPSSSEAIDIETLRARVAKERAAQDEALEDAVIHVKVTRGFARLLPIDAVAAYEEALAAGPSAPSELRVVGAATPVFVGFVTRG